MATEVEDLGRPLVWHQPPQMPAQRQAIVDMTAVRKAAAVSEAVLLNELICPGCIHEPVGEAPAALVEIARGTCVVPGERNMAAACEAADPARDIARFLKIGNEVLPLGLQVFCHRYTMTSYDVNGNKVWPWGLTVNGRMYMMHMPVTPGFSGSTEYSKREEPQG